MKRAIQLGMIWITAIILGWCGMMSSTKQESKGTTLSAEYEALCNSKNTLNKSLCRETMGQLPKFESEINAHFKEKFNIDGFKLTGINFPYTEMQHGGFNATFQLESDPYVMITGTFDYSSDGKYTIRHANTEGEERKDAGKHLLASAILVSEYLKTLPINKVENDLRSIGMINNLSLLYDDGSKFFEMKNMGYGIEGSQSMIIMNGGDDGEIVTSNGIKYDVASNIYKASYSQYLKENIKLFPINKVENENEARNKFLKFQEYIKLNDFNGIFFNRALWYIDTPVDYKIISNDLKSGEVVING